MKVKKGFFCSQEKKSYTEGEKYTGSRKDLGAYLEKPKVKARKPKTEDKNAAPVTENKGQKKTD